MNLSLGKGAWKGLQLGGLVLAMFATQHIGSGAIPSAQACSGGAPGAGWGELEVVNPDGLERVPIATDGFVLLQAVLRYEDLDSETPGVWVRVVSESGDELPGQLRILRAEGDHHKRIHFGWHPDQALAVGSVVELTAGEEDGAGGAGHEAAPAERVELEVVGEPTPLLAPTGRLQDWLTVRHGVGELVDCDSYTSCGLELAQAAIHEERLLGVDVTWTVPEVTGMVAWEARADTIDSSSRDLALFPFPLVFSGLDRRSAVQAGVVAFAEDAADHCAVLVVKDLRTGQEKRSEPLCGTPTKPQGERSDHEMASCEVPPVPEAFDLWCEYHAEDPLCDGVGTAGAPGAIGVPPVREIDEPTAPAGNGDEPSEGDDPAQTPRLSRGCGCQLAPAGGGIALTAVSVAVLLGLCRRRRVTPRD
jgi:hypothetical protein